MKSPLKNTAGMTRKERTRRIVTIASILFLLALFTLIGIYVGLPLVRQFRESPESFRAYVESHGALGKLLMIGITVLQVLIALLPGEPFELAAGFVFGWLQGGILCMIGCVIASSTVFMLVRTFGKKVVELFFQEDKIRQYAFLQNEKRLNILVFILFLIPGTPKDLLTYVVPLTPMKLSTFLWLTSLARIPSLFSSTVTGSLAQNENYVAAIITYAITFLVSGLLILWYRKTGLSQKTNEAQKQ